MKIRIIVILTFIITILSCHKKDKYEECQEFKESTQQYSYAISNYKDFIGYSYFYYSDKSNTYSIRFYELNNICLEKNIINYHLLDLQTNYTIYLTNNCNYYINDQDANLDIYELVREDSLKNWIYITDINADTSVISGKFNLNMSRENPSRMKDDPYRPDTLKFFNGIFKAELLIR